MKTVINQSISIQIFQKQSTFLDDMNSFINLAKQMGIIEKAYYSLPHSTKCRTIDEVYKSHLEATTTVILEVKDIYGMLVLLCLGVGLALSTFSVEMVRMNFSLSLNFLKLCQLT